MKMNTPPRLDAGPAQVAGLGQASYGLGSKAYLSISPDGGSPDASQLVPAAPPAAIHTHGCTFQGGLIDVQSLYYKTSEPNTRRADRHSVRQRRPSRKFSRCQKQASRSLDMKQGARSIDDVKKFSNNDLMELIKR